VILLILIYYIRFISLPEYYSYNPIEAKATCTLSMVWAVPVSLVTTQGISFDLFSTAT
jgi:hypothetical protein